jgi:hypothetical protein
MPDQARHDENTWNFYVIFEIFFGSGFARLGFQKINFTRLEGGDNTSSIYPIDNAVKLFF